MLSSIEAEAANTHDVPPPANLLTNLQTRANALLSELKAYQALLKSQKRHQDVEIRIFKRGVDSEVKSLEKIARMVANANGHHRIADGEEESEDGERPPLHALRSSNLPFYEAVWTVAKSSNCIIALGKRMYFTAKGRSMSEKTCEVEAMRCDPSAGNDPPQKGVLVDIVAENGLEWIKVSTLTEKRLLFEMAKQGWESYGDFSDVDESDASRDGASDHGESNGKLELVRIAEDLNAASKAVRVHFQHPRIRFVLPKIQEGTTQDVDAFLMDLRATGAVVECGGIIEHSENTVHSSTGTSSIGAQRSSESMQPLGFEHLMPAGPTVSLTDTINVDCTILLALISDISHLRRESLSSATISKSGEFHKAITRQIITEESAPLLPTEIYPVLDGRTLECTNHAAQRMREIVQCMGTGSERNRADIILGEGPYQGQPASILKQALSEASIHSVPLAFDLPIKVVDFDDQKDFLSATHDVTSDVQQRHAFCISMASRAKAKVHLTALNSSVFLYGWMKGIVTLTSNRTIASGLLKAVNELLDQDERDEIETSKIDDLFRGPLIYVCENARSLIGKEKGK